MEQRQRVHDAAGDGWSRSRRSIGVDRIASLRRPAQKHSQHVARGVLRGVQEDLQEGRGVDLVGGRRRGGRGSGGHGFYSFGVLIFFSPSDLTFFNAQREKHNLFERLWRPSARVAFHTARPLEQLEFRTRGGGLSRLLLPGGHEERPLVVVRVASKPRPFPSSTSPTPPWPPPPPPLPPSSPASARP